MYESQLAQLQQQTFNMESAALATENLRNTMATVDAMKIANKEMRKQYGKIDIDKIEVLYCSHFPWSFSDMVFRICITTWKTFLSRQTKFRNH